ncbi:MAG TPA: DUF6519 domain-containing protein [Bryobacteraceae bacterium]|nr:DUF6519 domain-containing protein [Bryobacteraceae bacterium]
MSTIDLSRSATDYRKHYKSVRAQQGRVFVDDDHNENERIHGEESREEMVEIIGPVGAPGDGFLISNPRLTSGKIDFDLAAGSLYVGGNRLKLDAATTFQTQPDWLEIFGSSSLKAPTSSRNDLVYVETALVPVSSVEDSETFEVALGGPDTSTRLRQLQRVRLFTGFSGANCQDGWSALASSLKSQKQGTFNSENELVPDTVLTVGFANNGASTDLCSPPVAGGYLGAENQAIRVQLTDTTHFTWGYDNAAPLYRVKVDLANGLLTEVTMLTEPKDQAHWPQAGQIVEFLPWSAVLPNNEKTAEVAGFLTRVASSYDPDQKQFTIDPADPLPATFGIDWKQRTDAPQLAPGASDVFFYMRVWNRGGDTTSAPGIPFVSGTPVDLTGTGLQVTFTGSDRPLSGYWIIAARPDSPDLVVPWALQTGRGPNGYRRFFAPLGVIQWTAGKATTGKVIDDCRHPFQPLTKLGGCCTVTVGDGLTSFGKFTSIQKAIDSLATTGGEICILPGTYTENFHTTELQHITIHGCGERTILQPKDPASPVATISDSQHITIRNVEIASDSSIGVLILSSAANVSKGSGCDHITIRAVHFVTRDASAIACYYATNVFIVENHIELKALTISLGNASPAGMAAAIFLFGENVEIARNRIAADSTQSLTSALGGIQLFGICETVRIEHNHIEGGNGNGITLGAVFLVDSTVDPATGLGTGAGFPTLGGIWIDPGGCVHVGGGTPPNGGDGKPQVPVAWGLFFDIRILDNDILNMGGSGIGSPDLPSGVQGLPIVEIIEIAHNRITGCAQLDRSDAVTSSKSALPGRGGIAIDVAGYAIIRDNWIALNGASFVLSICGVWIGVGSGVVIERNNILDNGPRIQTQQQFESGPRAGVRVEVAIAAVSLNLANNVGTAETEFPALRVEGNVVVAPSGPALAAIAVGPVVIADNQLTTGALDNPASSTWPIDIIRALIGGAAVFVFDIGTLSETSSAAVDFSTLALYNNGLAGGDATTSSSPDFVSGDILFNDNRVLLNFPDGARTRIISSVTLFGLADLSAQDNQFIARTGNHPLVSNAIAFGISVRVEGNRFQDRFDNGVSALTLGFMNATTNNQGTRCIHAAAETSLLVNTGNKSWVDLIANETCSSLKSALTGAYANAGYTFGQ